MSKPTEKRSFDEMVGWAEGYLLKELIAGHFHTGVATVLRVVTEWHAAPPTRVAKEDI